MSAPSTMTLAEADALLASLGIRDDMTEEELVAAVPEHLVGEVATALAVLNEALAQDCARLEAFIEGMAPYVG
jgi:hypothetical protein